MDEWNQVLQTVFSIWDPLSNVYPYYHLQRQVGHLLECEIDRQPSGPKHRDSKLVVPNIVGPTKSQCLLYPVVHWHTPT